MCVICGCNKNDPVMDPVVSPASGVDLHFGKGEAQVSVPGISQSRAIKIEADVLGENRRLAEINRAHFAAHGVTAYDIVSSPGSGKTTLLCATINALKVRAPAMPLGVIEGDQQTSVDADRIRATGVEAVQINTGKGCHLDAQMVGDAFSRLHLHSHASSHDHSASADSFDKDLHKKIANSAAGNESANALLLIENVGNLVCPAMWDLGEMAKIVILSVTEGDDKPLKYPDMFAAADLLIINKTDLLPYVDFDINQCIERVRTIQPRIDTLALSAISGEGIDPWLEWLMRDRDDKSIDRNSSPDLEHAIAE